MSLFLGIVAFALLFVLFAVSRAAEGGRSCAGRSGEGSTRCGGCPLRGDGGGTLGPCPGVEREDGQRVT